MLNFNERTAHAILLMLKDDLEMSGLPQEISNDIVQLLANSKQALMDFANIQTGEDIASFNQQYDVNLTLPQGA